MEPFFLSNPWGARLIRYYYHHYYFRVGLRRGGDGLLLVGAVNEPPRDGTVIAKSQKIVNGCES